LLVDDYSVGLVVDALLTDVALAAPVVVVVVAQLVAAHLVDLNEKRDFVV